MITTSQWDKSQAKLGAHFLQSSAWSAFQAALGRQTVQNESEGWSYLGILSASSKFTYLYCPYGPTILSSIGLGKAVESWKAEASGADFVRFEPVGAVTEHDLRMMGAKEVKETQPKHTLVLDLNLDEETLRSNLSSSHRNTINAAGRKGLSFRLSSGEADLKHFLRYIHATAGRNGFATHSDAYFATMVEVLEPLGAASVYIAEFEGKTVAAAIVFDYAGVRYYAHSAMDPEHRNLRIAAPFVWFLMMDAKMQGMHELDLWGIAPAGASKNHPWAGFTEFKHSFGGTEKAYLGTWELPLNPLKHMAYRTIRKTLGRG
jgi:lipid II:glycine glycyltransferase (peptidoglycan interpeptide bridge formation enzyme)